jgi:ferric-dicitrate binding protein FerR (iron transport regulator)
MAQVFVKEGKVLFAEKSRKRNNVRLTRGEKGIYEGKHVPMIKINAASDNSSSWVSHKLIFRNNSLSEVKNDIADFFSVQIRLSKELENCRFSGEFTNPELENVLEVIALSTSSTLRYEGNIIILEGNSCNN